MKKYLYILFPTLFLTAFTILVACSNVDNLVLSIMPKSYYIVEEQYQNQSFDVEIFSNLDKSFFSDIVQIEEVYIKDQAESNLIELELKSINKERSKIEINGKKHYIFIFNFCVNTNINSTEPFEIKESFLSLEYLNGKILDLKIGNFTYTRVTHIGSSNDDISVSHILGVKNTINQIDTLAGIEFELENRSSSTIRLNSVNSLDRNISFSLRNTISPSVVESPKQDVSDILSKDYDFFSDEQFLNLDYYIASGETLSFFIPIKYDELYKTNKLAFIINFEKQGLPGKIIFDNFLFFRDFSISLSEKSMIESYLYDFN